MAITVCGNCIEFGGSYTLRSTAPGFCLNGVIKAASGFCDTRFSPVQGTVSGYTSLGGRGGLAGPPNDAPQTDAIDKFPFSSDTNATDVGEMTIRRKGAAGQSSSTHGYAAGGVKFPATLLCNTIDKFPFTSDTNGTDVGDLSVARVNSSGQSSLTHGYTSAGAVCDCAPIPTLPGFWDRIDKFPFSSDSNASDIGELVQARASVAGQSTCDSGYVTRGCVNNNGLVNTIEKFPFSADTPATDVGEIDPIKSGSAGQSSQTHGYVSGGDSPIFDAIAKFSFSNETNSGDVGELSQARTVAAGQSSTASGYTSGGSDPTAGPSGPEVNYIDKFPFSSDASATDVGDLTQVRFRASGHQV